MTTCDSLDSTAVPKSFGTDDPPPPAYISKKAPARDAGAKMVNKCNKSLWIRYQSAGTVEVNGSVPTSSNWPEKVDIYRDLIIGAAHKHIVPAAWVAGFIAQESAGAPGAVSPMSAIGLMQIIMSTAKWLTDPAFPGKTPGHVGPTALELSDPALNIELGTKFLAYLMRRYNDNLIYVAGSYNHGSAECGDEVAIGDKDCPGTEHTWGLITNCGYVDGIINHVNRAVQEGYSGLREIDLDTEDMPSSAGEGGASFLSILLGITAGAGLVAGWRYLK